MLHFFVTLNGLRWRPMSHRRLPDRDRKRLAISESHRQKDSERQELTQPVARCHKMNKRRGGDSICPVFATGFQRARCVATSWSSVAYLPLVGQGHLRLFSVTWHCVQHSFSTIRGSKKCPSTDSSALDGRVGPMFQSAVASRSSRKW